MIYREIVIFLIHLSFEVHLNHYVFIFCHVLKKCTYFDVLTNILKHIKVLDYNLNIIIIFILFKVDILNVLNS